MNYNQISGLDSMDLMQLDQAVMESRGRLIDNYADRVREAVVDGDRFANGGSVRDSIGISSNPGVHAEVLATSDVLSFDRRLGDISYVDGCSPPSSCYVLKQGHEGDETTRLILSCLNDPVCLNRGELNIEHQGLAGKSKRGKEPSRLNHELNRGQISFDHDKVVACIKSQSCPSGEISPKEVYHHIVGADTATMHFGNDAIHRNAKRLKAMDGEIKGSIKGAVKDNLDKALTKVCPKSLKHVIDYQL